MEDTDAEYEEDYDHYNTSLALDLEDVKNAKDHDLYLDNHSLTSVPKKLIDEAAGFTSLTRIYLQNNNILSLPEEIAKLEGLLELNMHSNQLKELPNGIGNLHMLQILDISCNHVAVLPSSIGGMNSLESLLLSDNELVTIPKEICMLRSLRVLSVMNNKLHYIPTELTYCWSLTRLLLDRNNLKWLPKGICHLSNLEELSICKNNLLWLPLDLGVHGRLRSVYVDNNACLHALPISMSQLEVGFHSCGTSNYIPNQLESQFYNYVSLEEEGSPDVKHVYIPIELKALGRKHSFLVPSLLELSLRAVNKYNLHEAENTRDQLPATLRTQLLSGCSTNCAMCDTPMYTCTYPMLFEAQIHLYRLLRLVMCCSSTCVFHAARYTLLPLVYPHPDLLFMTVALIE